MFDPSKIRAITLDLDDTLWPVAPTIAGAERAMQDWLGERAPRTAALLAQLPQRMALRETVVAQTPECALDMSALRRNIIALALAQSEEPAHWCEPAFEVFYAARQKVTLYEDAQPALVRLAARFPLLALTNGNADVHLVGLGAYFCGSVGAHTRGQPKPHRAIFDAAAQHLDCNNAEVLHVGDDAHLDVLGAMAAGMQAVWLNRRGEPWAYGPAIAHLTVPTLDALCDALGV
jgi:putative hydrolase of the HAD superfamily